MGLFVGLCALVLFVLSRFVICLSVCLFICLFVCEVGPGFVCCIILRPMFFLLCDFGILLLIGVFFVYVLV